jgi:hypothetical protein
MKKRTKKRGRSVRRKSAMGAIDVTSILSVVVGAAISSFADKIVPATVDKKIVSGGKIALGVVLPMLVKDGKSKSILTAVGSGMIATATVDLLKSFGVLSGAEDEFLQVDLSGTEDVLAGDDISVINGNGVLAEDDISIINGDDDEENTDEVY